MNRVLRKLVMAAGILGAACFVAIELMVLYQLGGQFLPYIPRSADEFAGYFMAASAFLALAYTFAADEHIRVTIVLEHVGPGPREAIERVAVTLATVLAAYLAWHFCKLTWQSIGFDERSTGLIALPLWIPQAAMALGAVLFALVIADRTWRIWLGKPIETMREGGGEIRADR